MTDNKSHMKKCIHCPHYESDKRLNPDYIGVCTKYQRYVVDSLCRCESKYEDGKLITILYNFKR